MSFLDVGFAVGLVLSDAEDLVLGALLEPAWGVYLDGTPVIQPASVPTMLDGVEGAVSAALSAAATVASLVGAPSIGFGMIAPSVASTIQFEYAQDWSLPTYPQEQGAFQAYNKVTLPFDVKIRLASGGGAAERQAFVQSCLAIGASTALFDVVTPEMTFTSVNCSHVAVLPRDGKRGVSLIQVDLYFQQIPVVASTTFQNTSQPGDAGTQATGTQQPQTPSSYINGEFAAGGFT